MKTGSNYHKHALAEFQAAGWMKDGVFTDKWQGKMCQHVLSLLDVFHKEQHSGTTAHYAIDLFKKLASFAVIAPLTGDDEEWMEYAEGRFQNKRCSHVFKEVGPGARFNGRAYDSEGKFFIEIDDEGHEIAFTNVDSCVPILHFPYTPKRERVYVEKAGVLS